MLEKRIVESDVRCFGWRDIMITDRKIIDGVLDEFMPLCEIPHGSGNERALSDYLADRLTALDAG